MKKYDVYYYGRLMFYVTAADLQKAADHAEKVVSKLVNSTVQRTRLHVMEVQE